MAPKMHTPPDFSALEQAFSCQHGEFARLKDILAGLDADHHLDVPVESLKRLAEATEVTPVPAPTPTGVRA